MKTLFLLRHAKSSWADTGIPDFERPLNGRGQKTAPFVGNLMKERALIPELIICSPAKRARETANLVCLAAGFDEAIKFEPQIYEATVGTLVSIAAEIDNSYDSTLLVGHNPSFSGLVGHLSGSLEQMPTAAVANLEIDVETWPALRAQSGRLVWHVKPKQVLAQD